MSTVKLNGIEKYLNNDIKYSKRQKTDLFGGTRTVSATVAPKLSELAEEKSFLQADGQSIILKFDNEVAIQSAKEAFTLELKDINDNPIDGVPTVTNVEPNSSQTNAKQILLTLQFPIADNQTKITVNYEPQPNKRLVSAVESTIEVAGFSEEIINSFNDNPANVIATYVTTQNPTGSSSGSNRLARADTFYLEPETKNDQRWIDKMNPPAQEYSDPVKYIDYLNNVDRDDNNERFGEMFNDSGPMYQRFIQNILPRLNQEKTEPSTRPGAKDGEKISKADIVKDKIEEIKGTDQTMSKIITFVVGIYGTEDRQSAKYLINLKFELYKLQINGLRVLIKKFVDDDDDLQGQINMLLEITKKKVETMNEIMESAAKPKDKGGITQPKVADKLDKFLDILQNVDPDTAARDKDKISTFTQAKSVNQLTQQGGKPQTQAQLDAADFYKMVRILDSLYGFFKSEVIVKLVFLMNYTNEWDQGKNKLDDTVLRGLIEIVLTNLFVDITFIMEPEKNPLKQDVQNVNGTGKGDFFIQPKLFTMLQKLYEDDANGLPYKNILDQIDVFTRVHSAYVDFVKPPPSKAEANILPDSTYPFGNTKRVERPSIRPVATTGITAATPQKSCYIDYQDLGPNGSEGLGVKKDLDLNDPDLKKCKHMFFIPNLLVLLKKLTKSEIAGEMEAENYVDSGLPTSKLYLLLQKMLVSWKQIKMIYNQTKSGIIQPSFVKAINQKYSEVLNKQKVVYTYVRVRTDKTGAANPRFEIMPTTSEFISEDQNIMTISVKDIPYRIPEGGDKMKMVDWVKSIKDVDPENPAVYDEHKLDQTLTDDKKLMVKNIDNYYFGPFDGFYNNASNKEMGEGIYEQIKNKLLRGDTFCIFGYGQSGSGKTTSLIYADYETDKNKRDGMVIEILKQPEIVENYNEIELEMVNLYTTFPDNINKGGKTRWLINTMDLGVAQAGGGNNSFSPGQIYQYNGSKENSNGTSWEDHGYIQVGGSTPVYGYEGRIEPNDAGNCPNEVPGAAPTADIGTGQAQADWDKYDYKQISKLPTTDKIPSSNATSDATMKFKFDENLGSWVKSDAATPGDKDYLAYIISKNFEVGRQIEPTTNNPQSSRSHVVVKLSVTTKADTDKLNICAQPFKLLVCDLAGAENKFKCFGNPNDIDRFYKIYVPQIFDQADLKKRNNKKAPMYDPYRCIVNEKHKESTGDELLKQITERIKALVEDYKKAQQENSVSNAINIESELSTPQPLTQYYSTKNPKYTCTEPAYLTLKFGKDDAGVDRDLSGVDTVQQIKWYNDVLGFGQLLESEHNFDYESKSWNNKLDSFRQDFLDAKAYTTFFDNTKNPTEEQAASDWLETLLAYSRKIGSIKKSNVTNDNVTIASKWIDAIQLPEDFVLTYAKNLSSSVSENNWCVYLKARRTYNNINHDFDQTPEFVKRQKISNTSREMARLPTLSYGTVTADEQTEIDKIRNWLDDGSPTAFPQTQKLNKGVNLLKFNNLWLPIYNQSKKEIATSLKENNINDEYAQRVHNICKSYPSMFLWLNTYHSLGEPKTIEKDGQTITNPAVEKGHNSQANNIFNEFPENNPTPFNFNIVRKDSSPDSLGFKDAILWVKASDNNDIGEKRREDMKNIINSFAKKIISNLSIKTEKPIKAPSSAYPNLPSSVKMNFPSPPDAAALTERFNLQAERIRAHVILSRLYYNCQTRVEEGYFINLTLREMSKAIKDMIILVNELKPEMIYWDTLYHPYCYNLNIPSDSVYERPNPTGTESVIVDIIKKLAEIPNKTFAWSKKEEIKARDDPGNTGDAFDETAVPGQRGYPIYMPSKKWPKFGFIVFTVINTTLWTQKGAPVNNPPTPPYVNLSTLLFYWDNRMLDSVQKEITRIINFALKDDYYGNIPDIQPNVLNLDEMTINTVKMYFDIVLEIFEANNSSTLLGTLETTERLQKLNMKYMCYEDVIKKDLLDNFSDDLRQITARDTAVYERKYSTISIVNNNNETKSYNINYEV